MNDLPPTQPVRRMDTGANMTEKEPSNLPRSIKNRGPLARSRSDVMQLNQVTQKNMSRQREPLDGASFAYFVLLV